MATDELKEMLIDTYFGRNTTEKDWKRISKKMMGPDRVEVRTFENTKTGIQVWTFGDADDECWHPGGDHLYHLDIIDGEMCAAFNPVSYWNSNKCLWDQHCDFQLFTVYALPEWLELDEVCGNQFIVMIDDDKTEADVRKAFEDAGFLADKAFSDFMSSH